MKEIASTKKQLERLKSVNSVANEKMIVYPTEIERYAKEIDKFEHSIAKIHRRRQFESDAWQRVGLNIRLIEKFTEKSDINANNQEDPNSDDQLNGNSENKINGNSKVTTTTNDIPHGKYDIEFTHVDAQDLNRKYTFRVALSSDVKILGSNPKDLVSFSRVQLIEQKVAERSNDFRYFVLLLRDHIVQVKSS